jgi:hypothetical protein
MEELRTGFSQRHAVIAVGILCVYFILAGAMALTKRPWFDEAAFANPALDLITRGSMGATMSEPTGYSSAPGVAQVNVQTHVYYSMPLSHLGQALWYKVAGYGFLRMRLYHVLWGVGALLAWCFIVRVLTSAWPPALLAAFLIATDRGFVDAAASGRPDMMSAALAALAIAFYLGLRERSLGAAICWSQILLACALFTHPVGALAGFILAVLAFRFDFRRLRWQYLYIAAIPYLVGFGLWGLYISQDPEAFRTQFGRNSTGRAAGLLDPLGAIAREVRERFLDRMYLPGYAKGVRRIIILIPIIYALAVLLLAFRKLGPRLIAVIALAYFFVFGLLESTKPPFYLVHITPLMACCLAVWTWLEWNKEGVRRWAVAAVAGILVTTQVAWIAYACWQNPYRTAYAPAMTFLDRTAGSKSLIFGGSELGFHFGFYNNVVDDATLGYYSGKRANFIVVDDNGYGEAFKGYVARHPDLGRYVRKTLTEDYREVYRGPIYTIYQRRE